MYAKIKTQLCQLRSRVFTVADYRWIVDSPQPANAAPLATQLCFQMVDYSSLERSINYTQDQHPALQLLPLRSLPGVVKWATRVEELIVGPRWSKSPSRDLGYRVRFPSVS